MTELDNRSETSSLEEGRCNLINSPDKKKAYVPHPLENLCCKHLLVMELLKGRGATSECD
jgi:predicted unusual protein kinase regulating ubiquinone biosynthesis (AarF/ABC1/UbiB family)